MITFKQYLSEDVLTEAMVKKWFSKPVDVETAISVLNSSAKLGLEAIKNGGLIYRGFKGESSPKSGFMAFDSSTGKRTSRDTNNLYQLMMGDSKKMTDYPDRSHSFICTTYIGTAEKYGDFFGAYVMVPLDGTKIAMSAVDDIFNQQMKIRGFYVGSPDAISDLSKFFMSFGAKMNGSKWTDSAQIKAALKGASPEKILIHWALFVGPSHKLVFKDAKSNKKWYTLNDKWLSGKLSAAQAATISQLEKDLKAGKATVSGQLAEAFAFIKGNSTDIYTALATELADPKQMKLTLIDYGQQVPSYKECWFSGPCIAISLPVFAKILLRLQEQDFPIHKTVLNHMHTYLTDAKFKEKKEKK